MVTRTFWPVGHGGFTTEKFVFNQFTQFIMAYDCGSMCHGKIKEALGQAFPNGERIDALFLSHFDRDHVNGVEDLITSGLVSQIFIPFCSMDLALYYFLKAKTEEIEKNLDSSCSNLIKRFFFKRELDNEEVNHDYDIRVFKVFPLEATIPDDGQSIKSGQNTSLFFEWEFIPFNLGMESRIAEELWQSISDLYPECNENGLISIDRLSELLANNQDAFKKIKSRIKAIGRSNYHSLVLYSGPKDPSIISSSSVAYPGGCLYTGDFEASQGNISELCCYLETERWNKIRTIQIPHHGSHNNYHPDANLYDNGKFCVTFASENEKNYPFEDILKDIIANKGTHHKVTYSNYTKLIFEI